MILILVGAIWLYIAVNLNSVLGLIYVGLVSYYWIMENSGRVYKIIKSGSLEKHMITGLGLAFLFYIIGSRMFNSLAPALTPENARRLFVSIPAILDARLLLLIIGALIPISEELFFRGAFLPYLNTELKGNLLMILGVGGALFALWHITAFQADNLSLMSSFIFGALASYLTIKDNVLTPAIFFHIGYNSLVLLNSVGFNLTELLKLGGM
jgi:membrane protease YdiL (CAAX protease family)